MRFAAYAGTSMALATGVIVRAVHSRANFYSACVYLSQSNACLMILSNLLLLVVGSLLLGLQRLLYGPLRPIEIEQLYEKAWFAVTETCLAMTIFRDEVGAWFVVMFISLLVGKVWGWIGEGRVEILEQQPPADPRLFHARLSVSLGMSLMFDVYLLKYSIYTVQQQARPNMMVMFAFEFAVLTVNSLSTCLRYAISLREAIIIKEQTNIRLQERRQELIRERETAARNAAAAGEEPPEESPIDEMLDEDDIDAPGWEDKSRWVFYLDLATDFVKLFLYLTFFCVLCMFYGMPIHIIRDVALTIRSFYKRITDFMKYRHATRDMNERYSDATEEDVRSQDVCIICREGMRAWRETRSREAADAGPASPVDERLRAKKLPCGHILHLACLRSWLERQQNCPTCRTPVLTSGPNSPVAPRAPGQGVAGQAQAAPAEQGGADGGPRHVDQNRVRFFNLGPIRLGFGAGNDLRGLEQQLENQRAQHPNARNNQNVHQFGFSLGLGRQQRQALLASGQPMPQDTQSQLQMIEQQLMQDINSLALQAEQLQRVRALQGELASLRILHATSVTPHTPEQAITNQFQQQPQQFAGLRGNIWPPQPSLSTLGANASSQGIGSGNSYLPPGVTIPDGWTLLPLQPLSELHNPSVPSRNTSSGASSTPEAPIPSVSPSTDPSTAPQPNSAQTVATTQATAGSSETAMNISTAASEPLPPQSIQRVNRLPNRAEAIGEDIPRWSFQHTDQPSSSSTREASSPDSRARSIEMQHDIHVPEAEGKGKGRATTVEDVKDDDTAPGSA